MCTHTYANTIITVYQSVQGGERSAGGQSRGQRHSEDQTPPSSHHPPLHHPRSLPIKLLTLTSPLPITMMCMCAAPRHAETQLIPLTLCRLKLPCCVGGARALLPTFDLGRIDSSPGLCGRSPLTSEVVQSKPANHDGL